MTEEKTITISKQDLWKYSTFLLLALLVIGVVIFMSARDSTTAQVIRPTAPNEPSAVPTRQAQIRLSDLDDAPSIGDKNAPVTIIEFSDYVCSFCNRHHKQTQPLIEQNYVDSGEVRVVFLDFISVGNSQINSAPHCARELGGDEAFLEYQGALYDRIHVSGERPPSQASYRAMAVEMGLDGDEFMDCLDSGRYLQLVNDYTALGRQNGITGTPGFLVGNEKDGFELISGAHPFATFQKAIENY